MKRKRQPGKRPKGIITRGRVARKIVLTMMLPMRRLPRREPPGILGADHTAVTYVGHATTLIQTGGMNVLTDPIYSRRILLLRRLVEPGLPFDHLPKLDFVLLSHAHMDHCDLPTLRRLPKHTPVICPPNVGDLPRKAGLKEVIELPHHAHVDMGSLRVTSLPVRHFGHRFFHDTYRGYSSFLVEGGSKSVFFGGDTAYDERFKDVGRKHKVDVAVLPIGAYKPDTFRAVHCNPQDAVKIFHDLKATWLVPIHWGTFVLSYEPVEEPIEWLSAIRDHEELGDRVAILRHGEMQIF